MVVFTNHHINVQFLRKWLGHCAAGERIADSAASQHHQTQSGDVARAGSLAGESKGRLLSARHGFASLRFQAEYWLSIILLQEDMRLVIHQQVQQREEERQREKHRERQTEKAVGLQRSKSLRVKGEEGKGFFSFFKNKWRREAWAVESDRVDRPPSSGAR